MALINWQYKSFNELTILQLYAILQLRNEVFVLEQACLYQDADGKDQASFHLCGWDDNQSLVAYCRILPPGISYPQPSIGRVLTAITHRKTGAGKLLMQQAIKASLQQFNSGQIKISAQLYLRNFYQNLGFKTVGSSYLEDNIPHIEMLYSL